MPVWWCDRLPSLLTLTADGSQHKNMAAMLQDQKVLVITLALRHSDSNLHVEIDTVEGGVRATSFLCVLGFGLGIGSVVLYKLYSKLSARCQQRRKQQGTPEKHKRASSLAPESPSSPTHILQRTCQRRLVHSETCDDILLMSHRPYHPTNEYLFHSHSIDLGESLSGVPSPGSEMFISEIGEDTFESMDRLLEELHYVQDVVDGMDQTVKLLTPGEDQLRKEYNFHVFDNNLPDWEDSPQNGSSASSVVISDGPTDLNWDYQSDLVAATTNMNFVMKRPLFRAEDIPPEITEEEQSPVLDNSLISQNRNEIGGHNFLPRQRYCSEMVSAETQTECVPSPTSDLTHAGFQRNHWWQSLLQQSYNYTNGNLHEVNQKSEEHLDTMNGNNSSYNSPHPPSSPFRAQSTEHIGELVQIAQYVDKSMHMSYEMRKGYQMLSPLLGVDSLRCVGGGVLRAALFSVLMHNAQVLYANLVCALQRLQILLPKGYLENWDFPTNLDNKNVGETLLQCVAALFKKIEHLCSLKTPCERARSLQQAGGLSSELVEAVKVLMFTHQAAPLYCAQMDLDNFLKDRINAWGSSAALNNKELCLLGLSLGIQLEIIWPAQYGETSFIRQYPQEVASGVPKIRLVAESDDQYHVLCLA